MLSGASCRPPQRPPRCFLERGKPSRVRLALQRSWVVPTSNHLPCQLAGVPCCLLPVSMGQSEGRRRTGRRGAASGSHEPSMTTAPITGRNCALPRQPAPELQRRCPRSTKEATSVEPGGSDRPVGEAEDVLGDVVMPRLIAEVRASTSIRSTCFVVRICPLGRFDPLEARSATGMGGTSR